MRPPPFLSRMLRLALIILAVVHVMSCFYWLAKSASSDEEEMNNFLVVNSLPASESEAKLADKYIVAFYFTNTVVMHFSCRVVNCGLTSIFRHNCQLLSA